MDHFSGLKKRLLSQLKIIRETKRMQKRWFTTFLIILILTPPFFLSNDVGHADAFPIVELYTPKDDVLVKGFTNITWHAYDIQGFSLTVHLYFVLKNQNTWNHINEEPLENTGLYQWNCSQIQDGHYKIIIKVVNSNNYMSSDESGFFTIDNDNSPMHIQELTIYDSTIESSTYMRTYDDIQITMKITHAQHLKISDIHADLRCFQKSQYTIPDSFDGYEAQWNLPTVHCQRDNGQLTVNVSVDNLLFQQQNIIVDTIKPQLEIMDPKLGIYVFKNRLVPFKKTFIIGEIPVMLQPHDNFEISHIHIMVNGVQEAQLNAAPWYRILTKNHFGKCEITFEVFDNAGNSNLSAYTVFVFNMF